MEQELSQAATAAYSKRSSMKSLFADPVQALGLLLAFAPIFSGLIFRTYSYHVTPGWYEALRQMDFVNILLELGVILWAHSRGLDFASFFKGVDRYWKIAMMIFFATFWVGSVLYTPVVGYSLLRLSYWLIHIGFAVAVWHLLRENLPNAVEKLAIWLVIGVLAYLPLLLFHFSFPDISPDKVIWSSAMPGFLSVRIFGMWIAGALVFWLGHSGWLAKNGRFSIQAWLVTVLLMVLLFWSGTRAAMAGTMGALIVSSIFMKRLPSLHSFCALVAAVFAGVLLSTLVFIPDPAFGILQTERYLGRAGMDADAMSGGRLEMWKLTLNKIAESPVFGWGEGAFYWLVDFRNTAHLQPHNFILQFVFSWGTIASGAAAFIMLRLLWILHRCLAHFQQMIAPLMLLDATLIIALFDGALYHGRTIIPAAVGLALCLALSGKGKACST